MKEKEVLLPPQEVFNSLDKEITNIRHLENKMTFVFKDGYAIDVTPPVKSEWSIPPFFGGDPLSYGSSVQSVLIATSIIAIKQLQARVDSLEAEVAHLKEKQ